MKSKMIALLLSIMLGGLGVDRFYLGYTGMGILKLLTAGCFGILYIIDIVMIATGKLRPADGSNYDEDIVITSTPPQPTTNAYDDLKKLVELYEQGVLSDEEFSRKKAEVLERL